MPPDRALGVIFLEAQLQKDSLRVRPVRIVASGADSDPLEILFYEQPSPGMREKYWMLGDDVAFVRTNDGYRLPESTTEIPMPVSGTSYWWQDYAEAIIVLLPLGYTLTKEGSPPQAKQVGDRIALMWKPGPIKFEIARLKVPVAMEVRRILGRFGPEAKANRRGERAYVGKSPSNTSFWKTLPGILTAVGAAIGGVAALLTATVSLCNAGHCPLPSGAGAGTPAGPPIIQLAPIPLDFQTHKTSEYPITMSETVTNSGNSVLRMDAPPRVEGAGFTLSTTSTCYFQKQTMARGDRCVVNIVFYPPTGPNQYTGRLTIVDTFDQVSNSVTLRAIST